jgi:hypothetical protein
MAKLVLTALGMGQIDVGLPMVPWPLGLCPFRSCRMRSSLSMARSMPMATVIGTALFVQGHVAVASVFASLSFLAG